MTQAEIIQELFKARVSSRITQIELGVMAGYDKTQILRAEKGQITPRLQQVCDMADALGYELILQRKP